MRLRAQHAPLFAIFALILLLAGCLGDAGAQGGASNQSLQKQAQGNVSDGKAVPQAKAGAPPAAPIFGSPLMDTSALKNATPSQKLIVQVLSSYRLGDEESLDRVDELLALGPESADDLLELSRNNNPYAKWSALYAFSVVSHKVDEGQRQKIIQRLEQMAQNDAEPGLRVRAGSLLLSLGQKSGFEPVILSLNETNELFASQPPRAICTWADYSLQTYSGQNFGPACTRNGRMDDSIQKWENWWTENKDALQWNGTGFSVK